MGLFSWLFRPRAAARHEYAIFVSYSRRDIDIIAPLVQLLRLSGTGVFRDVDHIRPGTRWRAVLIDAVKSCELCLLFWCHHSAKSAEVRKEYTQAIEGGKLLTPVLLDDTPLIEPLTEYQSINMRGLFFHDEDLPGPNGVFRCIVPPTPDEVRRLAAEAKRRLMAGIGAQVRALEVQRQSQ